MTRSAAYRSGGPGPLAVLLAVLLALCAGAPVRAQQTETVDLSLGQQDVHILGEAAGDGAGFAVASGDLNNDGHSDIIVGAFKNSPLGRIQAGKVYVVLGRDSMPGTIDLTSDADFVVLGGVAADQLGRAVASADLNGDGYDDLIVGAPFSDPEGRSDAGRTYVFYGKASLPASIDLASQTADVVVRGKAASDILGTALATGDVNGDGFDDLIVGASRVDQGLLINIGETYLFHGSASLPAIIDLNTASAVASFLGKVTNDESGSVLDAGDVNGDGFDDILIGAPKADPNGNNSGEVYVIYGSAALSGQQSLSVPGVVVRGAGTSHQLGSAIGSGDINKDGFDDLVLGAPGATVAGNAFAGFTYVIFGSASLPANLNLGSTSANVQIAGKELNGSLGWSVVAANLNGDGYDEVITSAAFASPGGRAFAGEVFAIYGDASLSSSINLATATVDLQVLGAQANDQAGYYVSAGDINDDGVGDLIIGAPGASPLGRSAAGAVFLVLGTPPYLEIRVQTGSSTYNLPLTVSVHIDSTSGMKIVEADIRLPFHGDLLSFTGTTTTGTLSAGWAVTDTVIQGVGGPVDTLVVAATSPGPALTSKGEFIRLNFFVNKLRNAITATLDPEILSFNGGRTEWNQIAPGAITLLGNDGSMGATIVSEPGDTVRVRVIDVDLSIDAANAETYPVTLKNQRTSEMESVSLTEQSIDDTVYFGALRTAFGAAAGANDDGVLNVQAGDLVVVTYDDPLSAAGPVTAIVDTHKVLTLGDADGNGTAQAFDAARILGHAVGQLTLAGNDSLAANLDQAAPYGPITSFDAALVIQRRLGIISRFPVSLKDAANHPQPETASAKPAVDERRLRLVDQGEYIAAWIDERDQIVAGDLLVEGIRGRIEMGPGLERFHFASRSTDGGLRIGFAGDRPLRGEGELLRIYPLAGSGDIGAVRGEFNGGAIRLQGEVTQESPAVLPMRLALHPNFPNPFNAETLIRFDLPQDQPVHLAIYNALGQKVRTLVAGPMAAGFHAMAWDSRDDQGFPLASGTYFYTLVTDGQVQTQRMLLLK